AAGFDFSQGDSDGDGWVDVLNILHSGYGEESTGDSNDVWSVKGSMSSVVTKNGVKMYNYHEEPALRGSSGTSIERIGTICHETGHFFGLPDLYDYSPTTDGLGSWCLMSGGSWNGTSGTSPGHPSAWAKVFLGFAKTVPVHSKIGLALPRVEDNAVVGMLRDGMSNDEYFLIENRAKTGFDNSSQIKSGLLIYHVDQRSANNDLGTWPHPAVKIEEADGNDSLGIGGGGTQAGDVWTSTSGLAGGWRDQTGNTNTSAMLYQSGSLFSRTSDPASYTYNWLNNFSAAGSTMTFNVQSLKTDAPTQAALPAPFTIAWAPSSAATKYEIQEGSPTTLTSFFDGAESADALHDNWYVAGKTKCVVTNASHSGSVCYSMLQANYGAVQSLVLRKPFKLTTSTVISFYFASRISAGNGYIKCEISNDGGDTWQTLSTDNGNIAPWAARSFNYTAISATGISAGELCLLRFVVDIEYGSSYAGFPGAGFALDDISITGTEISGYDGWTTLSDNVTTNSYSVAAKPAGVYAYRVQAYANGAWQGYGSVGETTVGANHLPAFASNSVNGVDAQIGAGYSGNVGALVTDLDANDMLTVSKLSGPDWLTIAADGSFSGTPLPGDIGPNTFTVRVTDQSGAFAEAQINIFVRPPSSTLNTGLVAYLPFDGDFLDYSGYGNHPVEFGSNARSTGHLGANGYVLNSTGYLSFGMKPDLHFADTTEGNSNSFSVSFWAKIPAGSYTGAPPFIANKNWASDVSNGWAVASGPGTAGSGYFQMNFKESNANSRDYDSLNNALASGWHHYLVVFQRSGTRTCITYIDGVQADSRTMFATGVNIDGAGLSLNLGQDGTGAGTRGMWSGAQMDDFAFWRRVVTPAEVSAIYSAGTLGFDLAYAQAAPIITALSADVVLNHGETTNLIVTTYSATTSSYQWRLGGQPIDGATNNTLAVTHQGQAAALDLDVIVANAYGSTTSRVVVVTLQSSMSNQTLSFPTIGDKVTTDTVGLTATASSGLPVSFAIVSGLAQISDGTNLTFTGAGTVKVRALQAGDAQWAAATPVTNTFAVTKATTSITLGNMSQTFNGSNLVISATPGHPGLTIQITYNGSATAPVNAGNYQVIVTIQDGIYQGSVTGSLTIAKADQTITFGAIAAQVTTNTVALSATASSTLPVSFIVVDGPGVLSASTLTFTNAGSVSIVATQGGDTNWFAAAAVTNTFNVSQTAQTISFASIADQLTTNTVLLGATAGSGLTVSYELVSGANASLAGNALTFTGAGMVSVRALQAGNALWLAAEPVTNTFTVTKTPTSISLGGLSQTFNGSNLVISAAPGHPGLTLQIIYNGSATVPVNAGSYDVIVTILDGMYQGSATGTLMIAKAPQSITFPIIPAQLVTNTVLLAATATSGLPVSFSVASGPAERDGTTLTFTNIGTVSIVATQGGSTNWVAAAPVTNTFNVVNDLIQTPQTISFPTPGDKNLTNSVRLSATATSGLPVSFSVVDGPGLWNGTNLTFNGVGPVSIVAMQSGNGIWAAATPVTNTINVAPYPTYVKPDFVVDSIVTTPSTLNLGCTFTAVVTVRNSGAILGNAGTLKIWLNHGATATASEPADVSQTVGNLAIGATRQLTFSNLTAPGMAGTYNLRAFVDGNDLTPESSEGNNQKTLTYTLSSSGGSGSTGK
ncbi:MAG: M6 family metalloprotease domain-containing protein, partial [Kiritimatiellaeota bacterium]|nr:M6 family metalloprotease domain-containing protein [Kiritimatiellota bacterium]